MNAHTPGPWIAVTENDGEGSFEVRAPPYIIARCFGDPGHYTPANQRLIAAAPDLLAACEAANDWFSPGNDSYERKAEECYRETGFMRPGKDQPAAVSHSYDERSAAWNEWCAKRSAKVLADLRAAIAAAKGTR